MKNYMMLFCAAGLALCAACAKLPEGENDLVPESRLTVNLEGLPDLQTRATAATEAEKKLILQMEEECKRALADLK